jgi:hypothetical protein
MCRVRYKGSCMVMSHYHFLTAQFEVDVEALDRPRLHFTTFLLSPALSFHDLGVLCDLI